MERMREHVFKESDKDQDRLISFEEFLAETKKDEFEQDPGWETMDQEEDNEIFSDEEFRAYQAQRDREIQGMINRGQVPPGYPYYGNIPPGAQPYQIPHQMGGAPMGGVPGSIPGQPAFRPDQGYPPQPAGLGHPQQFAQHPQMGQPQMGQPQMGHPQMGQPQMGQPQMGQPQMAQPNLGQPQMGQPQAGQPQMRQPAQPQMGQPQMGQPVQPQMGQPVQPQVAQPVQPQVGQPAQPQVGQPAQPQMGQKPLPVDQKPQEVHDELKAPEHNDRKHQYPIYEDL